MILNIVLDFLKYLTLDILPNLLRFVIPLFQSLVQSFILAPQQNDDIEILPRKHLRVLEVKQQPPSCHIEVARNELHQFLFIEFLHLKLFIPLPKQLIISYHLGYRQILEIRQLLLIQQPRKRCLSCPRSTRHQNVRNSPRLVLLLLHHC